jgi:hypothetical protein
MKKYFTTSTAAILSLFILQSCDQNGTDTEQANQSPGAEMSDTAVVESGTYTGTANKVDPEEMEIYVELDNGKMIELYLKDDTELMQNGQAIDFADLKEGQKLEVEVEKSGQTLQPISVKVME